MHRLDHITVRGFKSISALEEFELGSLNVLIGPNGAGKSNFVDVFRMLARTAESRLQIYVAEEDGPDALLHRGIKRTRKLDIECVFRDYAYSLSLIPVGNNLVFDREQARSKGAPALSLGSAHYESNLTVNHVNDEAPVASLVHGAMSGWRTYHFADTSPASAIRQAQATRDNLRLKPNGGNLAPFLRHLRERHPGRFLRIVEAVRMVAPFFGDFVYRKAPGERIDLEWLEAGDPDTVRGQRQLSDGTLRFICLATLLLQPEHLQPQTILIDEPELGLHPHAISVLAGLLNQARETRQIVVCTQSADLVSEVGLEDVVVVELEDGESVFRRLDPDRLLHWLADYSLGDLWRMNVLGGGPGR